MDRGGIGVEEYIERSWELETVRFRFLSVGLHGLDALQYVKGDNWLGVAMSALMSFPRERAAWLGAEALRRLTTAPLTDQQRYLLGECVEAYLSLDDEQQRVFDELIATPPYEGVRAMNQTTYERGLEQGLERGLEQGLERGLEQGQRAMLREQLEERFGELPESAIQRLEAMSRQEMSRLARALMRAESLRDLGLAE